MRKDKFIKDEIRERAMNAMYNRIRVNKSVLLVGKYGSGKTELLGKLRPRGRRIVRVESLAPLPHIMGSILTQLDHDINLNNNNASMQHLETICALAERNPPVIIVDEANDLKPALWPYFKRLMNAGIPMIFAGLPKTRVLLATKFMDILSRLKTLTLTPLGLETYRANMEQFDQDALSILYGASGDNMRTFSEKCDDCLDKIQEMKLPKVTLAIAMMFVDAE